MKLNKLVVLTLSFLAPALSFADSNSKKFSYELGAEISHQRYMENHPYTNPAANLQENDSFMRMKSLTGGLNVAFQYNPEVIPYKFRIELRRSSTGKNGSKYREYRDITVTEGMTTQVTELRLLGKYDLQSLPLEVYSGLGLHHLTNKNSGQIHQGINGRASQPFKRTQDYWYIPVGVQYLFALNQIWSINNTLEFDYLILGRQTTTMSYENIDNGDFTREHSQSYRQRKGFGARAQVEFIKKGDKVDYLLGPFIRYWNISDSSSETTTAMTQLGLQTEATMEPRNRTIEYGLKFAVSL